MPCERVFPRRDHRSIRQGCQSWKGDGDDCAAGCPALPVQLPVDLCRPRFGFAEGLAIATGEFLCPFPLAIKAGAMAGGEGG